MSVLINMEMPKNCWEDDCPCLNKQYGFCQADDDKGFVYSNKPEWCPLVPVPPHGRLIDADALEKEHMKRAYENFRSYQFHVTATAWINEAPTIIPAEECE